MPGEKMILPNKFFATLAAIAVLICTAPAQASFHTWNISEIYSNSSNTIQFIELSNGNFNGQHVFNGQMISSNGSSFVFPSNLSSGSATANKRLVIGNAGYNAAIGASVPSDYLLPDFFFDPAGDTINFANVDSVTFTNLPTDGTNSFNYTGNNGAGQFTALNSPTNLAGQTGAIPEPGSIMVLGLFSGCAFVRRRRIR